MNENKMIVDLRSDTVTRPTAGMLEAMFSAKVGDDVFGEDETVNALQNKLSDLFGMEDALFCPSGTMTNQIGIKCFTNPMDEVICDETAHVYRYEGGGIAFNSSASVRLLYGDRGRLNADLIEPNVNPDNVAKGLQMAQGALKSLGLGVSGGGVAGGAMRGKHSRVY